MLAAVMQVACTGMGAAQDAWVETGADEQFPPQRFVVGVGFGDTMKDADDMAMGEVTKFFNTQVVSVTRQEEKYEQKTGTSGDSTNQEFESRTFTRVRGEAKLEGIEIVRRTVVSGTHYSMAALDRKKLAAKLAERLTFLNLKIQEALEANAANGAARVRGLARALFLMERRADLGKQLQMVGYNATLEPEKYRDLAAELRGLLAAGFGIGLVPVSAEVTDAGQEAVSGLVSEALAAHHLAVVAGDADTPIQVHVRAGMTDSQQADKVEIAYEVSLKAVRGTEVLAEKNRSDRLLHTSAANGRKKALFEIRDRIVEPFARDLEHAILGEYDKEENP